MKRLMPLIVFFVLTIYLGQITFADENTTPLENQKQDILKKFADEPTISDVQKMAIEYAEVHPDKIKHWRSAAKKQALLPNISMGLDRYVTDYWHWDSGTNPDTLQKGKDTVSWNVTMTWDMGELIWNSDQTSIDTRSKLMVQLWVSSVNGLSWLCLPWYLTPYNFNFG